MNIDETGIIEDCNENLALAWLLVNDYVFLNMLKSSENKYTTCIYVLCNDLFAWACADAEHVKCNDGEPNSEIVQLYEYCKDDPDFGYAKWCCKKRNSKPQNAFIKLMKEKGKWDDFMEQLSKNIYEQ